MAESKNGNQKSNPQLAYDGALPFPPRPQVVQQQNQQQKPTQPAPKPDITANKK